MTTNKSHACADCGGPCAYGAICCARCYGIRQRHPVDPNRHQPSGICECGCGLPTPVIARTRRGAVAGDFRRFFPGHQLREPIRKPEYRLEDRGYRTPCWIWIYGRTGSGYGGYPVGRRVVQAHRVIYEREVGPIPEGLELDHLCRVRECVNPDHLEPVTSAQNAYRSPLRTRLTAADVREIRESRASDTALAARYGVVRQTINDIRRGRRWREVQ